jgi:CheY-like chemotaxis protein
MEAGQLELVNESFDLRKLLSDVTQLFSFHLLEKNLSLRVRVDDAVPTHLLGDALRLRQILVNLVSNAIKFTERGAIEVTVDGPQHTDQGLALKFSVIDSGIGMDEPQVSRIFASFAQADSSITRRFGGTGLGLSICRQLVGLMGGVISVESVPGVGSSFSFTVNLSESQSQLGTEPSDEPAMPDDGTPLRDLKVLLVEDNPVNVIVARAILDGLGMQVTTAVDGLQAVEQALKAGGLLVHHALGGDPGVGAAALGGVAGEREGGAGEAEDGGVGGGPAESDRPHRRRQVALGVEGLEPVDIGVGAQGIREARALAGLKAQLHAHRLQGQQDVAEDDARIEAVAAQGLERDL